MGPGSKTDYRHWLFPDFMSPRADLLERIPVIPQYLWRIGSRTRNQILTSVDAQVPYIKWQSICM